MVSKARSYDDAGEHAAASAASSIWCCVHPSTTWRVYWPGQGTAGGRKCCKEEPSPRGAGSCRSAGGGLIRPAPPPPPEALKPDIRVVGTEAAMYPSFAARMRGLQAAIGGQARTIGRGHQRSNRLGEPDLRHRPGRAWDDVVLVEEAFLERAVALYANVEKTIAEGRRLGGAGGADGPPQPVPRQEGRADPVRRQHRLAAAGLGADCNAEMVREQRLFVAADHRRRSSGSASHRLGGDRPGGRQHHRGGPQPPGASTCQPRVRSSNS